MELSSSNVKEFLIFSYISGNENPQKKFHLFQETETLRKFLIFQETGLSYVLVSNCEFKK